MPVPDPTEVITGLPGFTPRHRDNGNRNGGHGGIDLDAAEQAARLPFYGKAAVGYGTLRRDVRSRQEFLAIVGGRP